MLCPLSEAPPITAFASHGLHTHLRPPTPDLTHAALGRYRCGRPGQRIGLDEPFMAAGLDSLGAVELQKAVAARFSTSVPATLVFDFPTLRALAPFVAAHAQLPQLAAGTGTAARRALQPMGAAEHAAEVLRQTLDAVRDVLGDRIQPDIPMMEVNVTHSLLLPPKLCIFPCCKDIYQQCFYMRKGV